jgi:hypothetical protein
MKLEKILLLVILVVTLFSCNHIESGDDLSKNDIERIEKLKLLDKGEKIIKFYSNEKNSVAGNFFTEKRLAMYWIDENDSTKNEVSFSFYQDIQSIDTVYYAGATYSPYMLITRKDSSTFKVYVDGKKPEIKSFFEGAMSKWDKARFKLPD